MKASAIIVAAGTGTRLGLKQPKAFVNIAQVSLLTRVLRTIGLVEAINEVVLAVPAGMERKARGETSASGLTLPVKITAGGDQRQNSVRIALALTSADADLIVVHDVARPFATPAMFTACIAAAAQTSAAIVATHLADTLKRVKDQEIIATVPRADLWQAQTPQAFRRDVLVRAHEQAGREQATVTDDAYLVERLGLKVEIVEGSAINFKVTTPDDLRIAEAIARFECLR
jgi:2-C-methyl-D-erythritol 4-phosphate cytidylyltransferase